MARCGADYWGLIKTANGATPEEPLTGIDGALGTPNPEDWWSWHNLAVSLHDKAEAQFKRLGEIEGAQPKGHKWAEWNRNLPRQHELHEAWNALGSFWTSGPASGIPKAIAVCEAAVCLLEGVDKSLAVYGEASHSAPVAGEPGMGDKVIGVVLLGAMLYGVYQLDKSAGDD